MDASHAKGVLSGIVASVCRELKLNTNLYRVKPGGQMTGGGLLEWYATVQSPPGAINVSRNTERARDLNLVKTEFVIVKSKANEPTFLKVYEWDATKDWKKSHRLVFAVDAEDMAGRKLVAEQFKSAVLSSQASDPRENVKPLA